VRCVWALGGRRSGNEIGHLVYSGSCPLGRGSPHLATIKYWVTQEYKVTEVLHYRVPLSRNVSRRPALYN
jgi:hypothetical protein